jgi:microcystin degradation protein MlrC
MMRVFCAGLLHETNTFSPILTTRADFRMTPGPQLVDMETWRSARREGIEVRALWKAHAPPSGPVTRDCYLGLQAEIIEGVRALLPVDGVLLHLHGAMEVQEIGDGQAALLSAVRAIVGSSALVAVTLDLHANLGPEAAGLCDIITAYRTAPHRDERETEQRGAALLARCLARGLRPVVRHVQVPVAVTGEAAVTEAEPAKTLYAGLSSIDARPGILSSSLLAGCPWTDSPSMGMSAVVCGTDSLAVDRETRGLATAIWNSRTSFQLEQPAADAGAAIAIAVRTAGALPAGSQPVFLSDSGDNVTAGAPGDSPFLLEQLIAARARGVLVAGITDPDAVRLCAGIGPGAERELSIGGRLDPRGTKPLRARVRMTRYVAIGAEQGPCAVVSTGGIDVILQSNRLPFTRPEHFSMVGVALGQHRVVAVKLGYLYPALRDIAAAKVLALTPGIADQRLDRLPYRRRRSPLYPFEPFPTDPPGFGGGRPLRTDTSHAADGRHS